MKNLSEALEAFSINYISEYRWKKDRMNNLSAEDFLKSTLTSLLDEVVMYEWRYGSSAYNSGYNDCRAALIKKINEIKK